MANRSPPTEPNGYYDIDKWVPDPDRKVDVILYDGRYFENCETYSLAGLIDIEGIFHTPSDCNDYVPVKYWKPRGWLAYRGIAPRLD